MYRQIAANKRKTILLMAGFVVFVALIGWVFSLALGNRSFVVGFSIFAVVYALISYYASAAITLALNKAKPIEKKDAPELYRIVENLAIAGGLPVPKIYIINDPAPNAFATGRDPEHAVVAVTTGLLEMMDEAELEGVIAHELSHVGNYDIRLMAVVVVLVTVVSLLSHFFLRWGFWGDDDDNGGGQAKAIFMVIGIVTAILAPIAATIVQLAISRRREYLADASGALLTRFPEGLERALTKIQNSQVKSTSANTATAHLYFANPFKGKGAGIASGIANMFSTHPPIADRIAKLKAMEDQV